MDVLSKEIYDAKYVLQTVLKQFPVKNLKIQNQTQYRIDCKVFDEVYDVIYFLVDKSDVMLNEDDTCDIVLIQNEYSVHYFYADEETEMIRENIHRCILTDAYYAAHPERKIFSFDLLCLPAGSVLESDSCFTLRLLSSQIVRGSFMVFDVPKKSLYWVRNVCVEKEYAHVDLKFGTYEITYKNKATRWKDAKMEVQKEDIMQDFLNSKRASYFGLAPKSYYEFLKQEYAFSHLFANLDA